MKIHTKCPSCNEPFTIRDISQSELNKRVIICRNCEKHAAPINPKHRRLYEILIIPMTTLLAAGFISEKLRIASYNGYLSNELSNALVYLLLAIFMVLQALVIVFLPHLLRNSYRKYKTEE